jgi:hypothetical protein
LREAENMQWGHEYVKNIALTLASVA